MTGENIVISIGGEMEGLRLELAKARKLMKMGLLDPKSVAAFKQQMGVLSKQYSTAFNNAFKQELGGTTISDVLGQSLLKRGSFDFNKMLKMDMASASAKQFISNLKNVKSTLSKVKKSFDMNSLGIMFFGMSILRVTSSISKSSRKMYQDIMHSVDGNVTAYDLLDTSMKKLQYQMGSALEPTFAKMIPLIDFMSGVVKNNKGEFAGLYENVLVVGGLLATGGTLALGIGALSGKFGTLNTKLLNFTNNAIGMKEVLGAGIVIGASIQLISAMIGDGELTAKSLANFLVNAGAGLLFINPGVGAAMITIGVGMKLLPEQFVVKFISILGIAFGGFMVVLAASVDTLLLPIMTVIKGLLMAYNYVTGSDVTVPKFMELQVKPCHN